MPWIGFALERKTNPFFLTLSHKAIHADFVPADRHKGQYKNKKLPLPKTFVKDGKNFLNKPRWLQDQRNSRHGVDFAYNLPDFDLNAYISDTAKPFWQSTKILAGSLIC